MQATPDTTIQEICASYGKDRGRLMDIVRAIQTQYGCVDDDSIDRIARELSLARVEIESTVSFYAFFSKSSKGKVVIHLCNDIIDQFNGFAEVANAFQAELGIRVGETTKDGKIGLAYAPCIGMCDQAPAALIDDVVVTRINKEQVREIVKTIKKTGDPQKLVSQLGDGNNAHPLVKAMVHNNIRQKGEVLFGISQANVGLTNALAMESVKVVGEIKNARLRGRGGAGFPTGMKWDFTRAAEGTQKYILCNADEGEPGTFKDRVILTELPDMLFEGMTIAGYAIGASSGIVYLRGEYAYLYEFLNDVLKQRREKKLLGDNILGKQGFNFDIRIQLGAGAYVCGEETALISSCEGKRGDPKTRPPFPAQKGYHGCPTTVNNVETLCCVARIMEKGADWFSQMGCKDTAGTKLLSICGDCEQPGIYEVPFGITLREVLKLAGAKDPVAVQVGGPSGEMVAAAQFDRKITYNDLATGGAIAVFGPQRNLLEVVNYYMEFFIEESCGYCTPCRAGNVLLQKYLERIRLGHGTLSDINAIQSIAESIKMSSRCGLGQTSPNPILCTLKNFRPLYEALVKDNKEGIQSSFDLAAGLREAEAIAGRKSVHE